MAAQAGDPQTCRNSGALPGLPPDHGGQHQEQRQRHGEQDGGHGDVEGPLQGQAGPAAAELAQRDQRDAPDLVQAAARDGLADLVQPRHHADVGRQAPAGTQDRHQVLVAPVPVADDHPADAQRGDHLSQVLGPPQRRLGQVAARRPGVQEAADPQAQLGMLAQLPGQVRAERPGADDQALGQRGLAGGARPAAAALAAQPARAADDQPGRHAAPRRAGQAGAPGRISPAGISPAMPSRAAGTRMAVRIRPAWSDTRRQIRSRCRPAADRPTSTASAYTVARAAARPSGEVRPPAARRRASPPPGPPRRPAATRRRARPDGPGRPSRTVGGTATGGALGRRQRPAAGRRPGRGSRVPMRLPRAPIHAAAGAPARPAVGAPARPVMRVWSHQ